jgi:murein DD-endopeptidase MepM/ murein hydrolase activator NlpD
MDPRSQLVAVLTGLGLTLGWSAAPPIVGAVNTAGTGGAVGTLGAVSAVATGGRGAPSAAAESGWAWPLTPTPTIARPFNPPLRRWEPGHRGVDLVGSVGDEVRAPASGQVVFASQLAGRGVVVVRHESGLRSTFEPVTASVGLGTAVTKAEVIGHVAEGPSHCAPQTCLHWGVLRGREYLDPLAFLGRAPTVLLPLG